MLYQLQKNCKAILLLTVFLIMGFSAMPRFETSSKKALQLTDWTAKGVRLFGTNYSLRELYANSVGFSYGQKAQVSQGAEVSQALATFQCVRG